MKKSLKVISAVLLAALLGTAAIVPVSAKTLFVSQEIATLVPNSPKAAEIDAPGALVYKQETSIYTSVFQLPDCRPDFSRWGWSRPACGDILRGGCYYSVEDGRRAVNAYLDSNSYNTIMLIGDRRSFCDGAYYYSTDPSVVYYDYATGKLVAKAHGTAAVYVYTAGGVPITRLDVNVRTELPFEKNADTLILTPDNWNPLIGGSCKIGVRSASGKVYDDIVFSIRNGEGRATIGDRTGLLTGYSNGSVIVRAYSKSNDRIYGETLLYIGGYTASVYDGGWTTCKDGIRVSNWGYDVYDVCGMNGSYVSGWIFTDGIYLPVIRMYDAVQTNPDGTKTGTKILTGSSLSYLDLLRMAYGNKYSVTNVIGMYNLEKYGYPGVVFNTFDYRTILLASILGLLK